MVRTPAFVSTTIELCNAEIDRKTTEYREPMMVEQTKELLHLRSEALRVEHMLDLVPKHTSLIDSMHRTLLEFPAPLLATSDQPVTVVPLLADGATARVEAMPRTGFLATEEIRFAIDPRRALLFTWVDGFELGQPVLADDDRAAEPNRAVYRSG